MTSWLNGKPTKSIEINDRGLLYGDGFFTTIKVLNKQIQRWPLHLERISFSATRLGFVGIDANQLLSELKAFIAEQSQAEGIIRLTITRGAATKGERGYKASKEPQIQRIMSWNNVDLQKVQKLQEGVKLSICDTALSSNKALAGVKHLNRLDSVMAQQEIAEDCFDGLMLANGFMISGSKSNIYFYLNNRWLTPKVKYAGVDGTVRRWMLGSVENCHESKFGMEILERAEYCLVSNALVGIIPVTQIGERKFSISPDAAKLNQNYNND